MSYPVFRNQDWSSLTDLRREMDRLFSDFWTVPSAKSLSAPQQEWRPACDVEEADDHFLLTLEMPGVPKENIKLEVIDNQIIISGERQRKAKTKEEGLWYSERYYGKFQRNFTLPPGIDGSKVEASHQDGILRLYIPKAESTKPRQIKINSSGGFFNKLLGQASKKDADMLRSAEPSSEEKESAH